ncbi:MAG: hypothetical protein OSB26_14795 [Woeseiaceae bacterium]|jgi:hypothetical protein|nr:hypothetical protein [Woeseiaceae bacterium]|tara:strand:- start:355 stop:633 length:279 start_codon:yes stop_codon:yes gene_type:complete
MKRLVTLGILGATASMVGCGGAPDTCEELLFYEYAESGKRIDAPDGLDGLAASRELVIPSASPREAREPGSGCLDKPPTLSTDVEGELHTEG